MAVAFLSPLFFFILILIPSFVAARHSAHPHTTNASDHHALLAFKSAITYDPFHSLSDWTSNLSFCNWTAITCSPRRQRVVSIDLSDSGLEGTISPFLGNLSFLRLLDLSNNTFAGHIPIQLGTLSRLTELYLFTNRMQGSIPATLSACRRLQAISLGKNHLTGSIPSELGFLPNLKFTYFSRNNLTGTIPISLGNISSLEYLQIRENKLHGPIPRELGMLGQLKSLLLGFNHLSGEIPSSLSNCTALQFVGLVDNYLVGDIPELCSVNNRLIELYLDINQLSGRIPHTLSNCTQLQILDLAGNKLSGTVPTDLGKLSRLTWLNLGYNEFVSGSTTSLPILSALINCSRLEYLFLYGNNFTGVIPSSVGQRSTKLQYLVLDENKIWGEVPQNIGNLTSLTIIDLSRNLFMASIPFALGMLRSLEYLDLSNNNFQGNIPAAISQLKNLTFLYLSENKFSGNIPRSFAHLQQIRHLHVDHNQLTGNIPSSLGECMKLELLDLSYNKLSGHIPPQVAGLQNLAFYFNLSNNLLEGPLPLELNKMDKVQAIDISANQLTGHIPSALASCVALEYLNLSSNKLKGPIPDSVSKLQNLQDLDLSSNNLTGKIPMALGNLKVLQSLNVSLNRLSGEVPKDGVFQNLSSTSFIGNLGLCGPWVKLPACSTPQHKTFWHLKKVLIPIVGIAIFVICCLCIGFGWRHYWKRHPMGSRPFEIGPQRISFEDLVAATNGFHEDNLLGAGNFGKVYKGVLRDGTMVAIKVFNLQNEDAYKSFDRECNVLRRVRHRNLLRIITSYSDLDFKALIFPLVPNGSLDKFLYPEDEESSLQGQVCGLNLIQRLNIALDIAQCIEYLHHYCFVQVIHCDLKPTNVLLGEDFTAYVTDFGISKLFFENCIDPHTSTNTLKGSIGYIAPEYGMGGIVTTKGDVYSYGIVLLEMVTAKKPTNEIFVEGLNLQKWVSTGFPNTIPNVVDGHLLSETTSIEAYKVSNCLQQLISLGLLCAKESPEERPSMRDIVRILHSIRGTFLGIASTPTFQSDLTSLLASTSVVGRDEGSQSSSF